MPTNTAAVASTTPTRYQIQKGRNHRMGSAWFQFQASMERIKRMTAAAIHHFLIEGYQIFF